MQPPFHVDYILPWFYCIEPNHNICPYCREKLFRDTLLSTDDIRKINEVSAAEWLAGSEDSDEDSDGDDYDNSDEELDEESERIQRMNSTANPTTNPTTTLNDYSDPDEVPPDHYQCVVGHIGSVNQCTCCGR
jgi:hypothetical protein